jgi:MarR family transcriptional regulator, organic hydroperoxide resistance regulator
VTPLTRTKWPAVTSNASPEISAAARAPRLDELLCFAIYQTNHALNRIYKPLLQDHALTYPQYLVLVTLWERDDRSVGDLGAALGLESNTLTPLLKRLEGSGYLTRTRNPADERQVRVRLTEAGRRIEDKARGIADCVADAGGLGRAELDDLLAQMKTLRDRLDAGTATSP